MATGEAILDVQGYTYTLTAAFLHSTPNPASSSHAAGSFRARSSLRRTHACHRRSADLRAEPGGVTLPKHCLIRHAWLPAQAATRAISMSSADPRMDFRSEMMFRFTPQRCRKLVNVPKAAFILDALMAGIAAQASLLEVSTLREHQM